MAATPERSGPWLASLVAGALALTLVAAVAPSVHLGPILAVVLAFGCVSAETLLSARLTPTFAPRALFGLALPAVALTVVAWAGTALPSALAAAIVTAALLGAGTLAGGVVGSRIDHAGHLVVVAIVSGVVDTFSVLHPSGPTAQLVQNDTAISLLVLPWPILGSERIEPLLGVGDITFAALYLAAARRHRLPVSRTLVALALGLAATLATVLLTGIGVPALPFLGLAVVLAHPEARRIPPTDRPKALVGIATVILLFGALAWLR